MDINQNLVEEDDVIKLYSSTLEIANYYDNIRNIEKTMKYSFKLCEEDDHDTIGLTKIIYWSSQLKKYNNIFKLMELIKGNNIKLDKFKEIFLRENKISIKNFLIKQYIFLIKKKEDLILSLNPHISIDVKRSSDYLETLYGFMYDYDIYVIYLEIQKEQQIINEIKSNNNIS